MEFRLEAKNINKQEFFCKNYKNNLKITFNVNIVVVVAKHPHASYNTISHRDRKRFLYNTTRLSCMRLAAYRQTGG